MAISSASTGTFASNRSLQLYKYTIVSPRIDIGESHISEEVEIVQIKQGVTPDTQGMPYKILFDI